MQHSLCLLIRLLILFQTCVSAKKGLIKALLSASQSFSRTTFSQQRIEGFSRNCM